MITLKATVVARQQTDQSPGMMRITLSTGATVPGPTHAGMVDMAVPDSDGEIFKMGARVDVVITVTAAEERKTGSVVSLVKSEPAESLPADAC